MTSITSMTSRTRHHFLSASLGVSALFAALSVGRGGGKKDDGGLPTSKQKGSAKGYAFLAAGGVRAEVVGGTSGTTGSDAALPLPGITGGGDSPGGSRLTTKNVSARRGRAAWTLVGLLAFGGLATGCDMDDEAEDGGKTTMVAASEDAPAVAGGESRGKETSMEWETKTDPNEGAFTIELPKGWKNDAYLKREGIFTVTIATAESPDGADALFYGDPKMPRFVDPQAALPQNRSDPNTRIEPYKPAETFLPQYVKTRYSKLPGFKITGVSSEPELVEKNRQTLQKINVPIQGLHSARVDFDFQQGGQVRHGSLFGSTLNMGIIWSASVAGIVSSGDPSRLRSSLFHALDSQKASPEWKEKERVAASDRQRQHEYIMAQIAHNTEILKSNHASNMATLSGMAVRHQARMDAIHAAGDASTAAYNARDVASDNTQRGFLNYINDEHTVSGASGRTFQVENKYDRYYVNKSDNSYIGLKGGTSLNDLNGVNPGDYEEAKVIR